MKTYRRPLRLELLESRELLAAFTPGNLVVYRVGAGAVNLVSTGSPVFLDEYSPAGALVQSIALPTVADGSNRPLVASGTSYSEGLLSRSADGHSLVVPGYDVPLGGAVALSSTSAASVPRVVGRVSASGAVDTTTALTDFADASSPRSAASTNGTDFWLAGGSGGVRYASLGSTTSTQLSTAATNLRQANVFDGQLYVSTGSGSAFRIAAVGAGCPTTAGQSLAGLPGFPTSGSPYGFFLADLDPGVAGADTLYVADDGPGALAKYSLVAGQWSANGTVGAEADDYRALCATVDGSVVTLYATRNAGSSASGGGELVRLVDASGYNGALSATPGLLAAAAPKTAFRGVALAPVAAEVPRPDLMVRASGPATAQAGTAYDYTLAALNPGDADAAGVVVQLVLPARAEYQGASLTHGFSASESGGLVTFSGGLLPAGASATLRVSVVAAAPGTVTLPAASVVIDPWDIVAEANEANNTSPSAVSTVVMQGAPRIHDIQGRGHVSPLAGLVVEGVPGIVTQLRSNGFYFQDPVPDADPGTSEGLFVYTGSAPAVAVGDSVLVGGTVSEYRTGGSASANLTTTEITGPTVAVVAPGHPLPEPVVLGAGGRPVPVRVIDDDAATGDVETGGLFEPEADGIDFYESLEGMRVQVNNALVVGPTVRSGTSPSSSAELCVVADCGAGAGLATLRGGLALRPGDFNPERIVVAGTNSSLPDAEVGDRFPAPVVGVLDYDAGNFKLRPEAALPAPQATSLAKESTWLTRSADQLTAATFNVENLSPASPASKFAALAQAIVVNLGSPDLLALEEVQDNSGPSDDGVVAADQTLSMLIDAILAAGGPVYGYRQIDPLDGQDGGEPGGNIRQAFLFRTDRGLAFVDRARGDAVTPVSIQTAAGRPLLSASPGRIDPQNPAFQASRKPLAGEFTFQGQPLLVVACHFNSKVGDDPLFGRHQPPALVTEAKRLQQARSVADFVAAFETLDPRANVLVLGDLNDFEWSAPVAALEGAGLADVLRRVAAEDRYTYVYEGNSQALDHALVNPRAALVADAQDIVHLNAESIEANRTSDHDPIVIRLSAGGSLDADGNGEADALTDGILILRYLFDPAGPWDVADALGGASWRSVRDDIRAFLDVGRSACLDADGNGTADPLSDGILVLRYLFEPEGAWPVADALGAGATRTDAAAIRAYLDAYSPRVRQQAADRVHLAALVAAELSRQAAADDPFDWTSWRARPDT